eukprot:297968-Rhodomonas_salina.2
MKAHRIRPRNPNSSGGGGSKKESLFTPASQKKRWLQANSTSKLSNSTAWDDANLSAFKAEASEDEEVLGWLQRSALDRSTPDRSSHPAKSYETSNLTKSHRRSEENPQKSVSPPEIKHKHEESTSFLSVVSSLVAMLTSAWLSASRVELSVLCKLPLRGGAAISVESFRPRRAEVLTSGLPLPGGFWTLRGSEMSTDLAFRAPSLSGSCRSNGGSLTALRRVRCTVWF